MRRVDPIRIIRRYQAPKVGFFPVVFVSVLAGCNPSTTSRDHADDKPADITTVSTSATPSPSISVATSATAAPAKPPPITITLSAVGDCTFGGGIENGLDVTPFDQMMAKHKDDLTYPFSGILDIFRRDDVTIVNLEGTLTTATEPIPEGKFHFRGKPEYARILKESSVEIANVANNHMGDFGVRGQEDTRKALLDAGVGVCGNGNIDRRTIQGIEVVNLGFTGIHMTRKKVQSGIKSVKTTENLVIASFHWGVEGTHEVIDIQREFGRLAIDSGADVVLGHHPHVVQAIETYQGKHIVHSLGNFVFGANTNPQKLESMIYRATFVQEQGRMLPSTHEVFPVRLCKALPCTEFRPTLLEGEEKSKFLDWLGKENEKIDKRPYPLIKY